MRSPLLRTLACVALCAMVVCCHVSLIAVAAVAGDDDDATEITAFSVPIRAWYPVEMSSNHSAARGGLGLVSRTQTRCVPTTSEADAASAAVDTFEPGTGLEMPCAAGEVPSTEVRFTEWNTLMAPGLYRTDDVFRLQGDGPVKNRTVSATLRCATLPCTTNALTDDSDDTGGILANLTGGLSPSTPCCTRYSNNTFIIRTDPARLILQTLNLPFLSLINPSYQLARAAACPPSENTSAVASSSSSSVVASSTDSTSDAASSSADSAADTCPVTLGLCVIRLLDPRFFFAQTVHARWNGDGGLTFPVTVDLCRSTISSVFNLNNFELITRDLHAVITTAEHVNDLTLPRELIRGVLSWIAANASLGFSRDGSLDSRQLCTWFTDPDQASTYRTGEYAECWLDMSVVGKLPSLILSVPRDRLLSSALAEFQALVSQCRIALDLNQLIDPETGVMRLYSSGSFTDAVTATTSLVRYVEPLVVVGAFFLRGATLGVSRAVVATIAEDVSSSSSSMGGGASDTAPLLDAAWRGLPLLYIAAALPANVADLSPSTCAVTEKGTCILEDTYFASMNRCVAVHCTGVVGYYFNTDTLTCGPSIVFVAILSFFFVITIVVEVVFVAIHRRTERAKYAHLDLIEEAQRKKRN